MHMTVESRENHTSEDTSSDEHLKLGMELLGLITAATIIAGLLGSSDDGAVSAVRQYFFDNLSRIFH